MRWTLKFELTTDDGKTQVSDVGSIVRSSSDLQPEEVGLTLEEGRLLIRDIECRLIADQVHAYTMSWRRCPHCGRQQHFKGVRTKWTYVGSSVMRSAGCAPAEITVATRASESKPQSATLRGTSAGIGGRCLTLRELELLASVSPQRMSNRS
jgi:hypothetical protein